MKKDNCDIGLDEKVLQAIEEMKVEQGEHFSFEKLNLAELGRRTGVSRKKLRRLKKNGFTGNPHGAKGRKSSQTLLTGYTAVLDALLRKGVTNSSRCLEELQNNGYTGSLTTVKRYIASHRYLVPAKRQITTSQGNRGRRFTTEPGEAFQMDWGFVKAENHAGQESTVACFAMICHHCGTMFTEFFTNARQESLFIGMLHGFRYMGIPAHVLTDNMKSVVDHRDLEGYPVWNKDYEVFMRTVGFQTKLCKPRHPFTKGKVERLIRYVKENFLAGRSFWNVTHMNREAMDWCTRENAAYHKSVYGIPQDTHFTACAKKLRGLEETSDIRRYLCPLRKISFDGFVNYEDRRFGVPGSYTEPTASVMREDDRIYIYSTDLSRLLTTHEVTWGRQDCFCEDQYVNTAQPEEFPTSPVQSRITMLKPLPPDLSFEKFNFDKGGKENG